MLISKEVEMAVNPENIIRLEKLGYEIPRYYNKDKKKMTYKRGTKILISVEDLLPKSPCLVDVECDYCHTLKQIRYRDYYRSINSSDINKYSCENCKSLKKREITNYKQRYNLLNKGDKGYWTFKENRLLELKLYIEKYKTIHGMQSNKEGALIYSIYTLYKDNIENACIELGYEYKDLLRFEREETYYDIYDNLKNDIQDLCWELGRFPKQQEILSMLHIANERLLKFGGIKSIKIDMGYYDKDDLVDDRGFYNRSICEYMTAQFLIAYNIFYSREEHPFSGKYKNYRSDFTLYPSNNKIIQVEVWGFPNNDSTAKRAVSYNKKRKLKESLYDKYNYLLISIDYEIFYKRNYKDILTSLYNIFKDFLELEYNYIEQDIIIPPNKLTDIELLNEIMKYSDDINMLPMQNILTKNGKTGLFLEASKRYDTYYNFANKFNKYTHYQVNKWTKESIFEGFQYMINTYSHILKNNEYRKLSVEDRNITGFMEAAKKYYGDCIDAKICFYEFCLNNNIILSDFELLYLDDLINCRNGFNKKTSTTIRIDKAKFILSKSNFKEVI